MTRQDYIFHLDHLRKGVIELMNYDADHKAHNGALAGATSHEEDRAKKTEKMFQDLAIRLYEDAAISERVKQDKIKAGDLEQAEITFPTTIGGEE